MPVSSPSDELVSTTHAALIASQIASAGGNLVYVSADMIRRAVRDGQLTAEKIGDRYLIRRADVEAWARRRDEGQKRS